MKDSVSRLESSEASSFSFFLYRVLSKTALKTNCFKKVSGERREGKKSGKERKRKEEWK